MLIKNSLRDRFTNSLFLFLLQSVCFLLNLLEAFFILIPADTVGGLNISWRHLETRNKIYTLYLNFIIADSQSFPRYSKLFCQFSQFTCFVKYCQIIWLFFLYVRTVSVFRTHLGRLPSFSKNYTLYFSEILN